MSKTEVTLHNSIPLILVADDDRATRTLLKVAMEEEGYRVVTAKDGQECLREYNRSHPDMVLLDAVMPEMDGFTCCRSLNKQGIDAIPILMITALDDQESIDRAFAAGAVDYITKPIHWAVLSQRVKRLLTNSQALKELENLQTQINQQQQWFQAFGAITEQFRQPLDLESFLREILAKIRDLVHADRVILSLTNSYRFESLTPGFASTKSLASEILGLEDIYKSQYQEGKIITLNNLTEADLPKNLLVPWLELETHSLLNAPIIYSGKILGLLSVHHCQSSYVWTAWQVEQFFSFTNLLAGVLANLRCL